MTEPQKVAPPAPYIRPQADGSGIDCNECGQLLDELLSEAARGGQLALDRLVAMVQPLIVRYCRASLGGGPAAIHAENVAHEICVTVRRVLTRRRIAGVRLPGLVYGIASRKVAKARREPSSVPADRRSPSTGRSRPTSTPPTMGSAVIHQLLESIAPYQREVLTLRIVVGLSCEQSAHALGLTPGEVQIIQHRALNRLRRALSETDGLADHPDRDHPA